MLKRFIKFDTNTLLIVGGFLWIFFTGKCNKSIPDSKGWEVAAKSEQQQRLKSETEKEQLKHANDSLINVLEDRDKAKQNEGKKIVNTISRLTNTELVDEVTTYGK